MFSWHCLLLLNVESYSFSPSSSRFFKVHGCNHGVYLAADSRTWNVFFSSSCVWICGWLLWLPPPLVLLADRSLGLSWVCSAVGFLCVLPWMLFLSHSCILFMDIFPTKKTHDMLKITFLWLFVRFSLWTMSKCACLLGKVTPLYACFFQAHCWIMKFGCGFLREFLQYNLYHCKSWFQWQNLLCIILFTEIRPRSSKVLGCLNTIHTCLGS